MEKNKKGPYKVNAQTGKVYWWCSCGLSDNQPFCDGSHEGRDIKPKSFKAEKDGDIWLCGCKKTKNPPFCDGTHNSL
ncbi:MAG: hypothetical protein A2491_20370 [Bacteroidetes bacterium RIFOXYC12_FULL_35_7]|nr:MAG: hypothetical protein A2491_20370 [Bacteroidetes bacterium RIFOXYC12_FULL_35_7]